VGVIIVETYVQVGQVALRSPSGEFLPAVPLFIREQDAGGRSEITGLTVAEELLNVDVSKVFADKFKQYAETVTCTARGCGFEFTPKFLEEYDGDTCPNCGENIKKLKPKRRGRPKKMEGNAAET